MAFFQKGKMPILFIHTVIYPLLRKLLPVGNLLNTSNQIPK